MHLCIYKLFKDSHHRTSSLLLLHQSRTDNTVLRLPSKKTNSFYVAIALGAKVRV